MNDYKITYNEESGQYSLEHCDEVLFWGSWQEVVKEFATYLLNDPVYSADNMHDAMESVREMISEQISDEDLNGYMLQDLSDDIRDQQKLNQLVLDFACDVLDVMRTAKSELFGASKEVRAQIKITAYAAVQEVIDRYADELQKGDFY